MTAVRGGADVAAPRNRNAPVTIGMVMDETIMTPNDPSSGGNERGDTEKVDIVIVTYRLSNQDQLRRLH